MTKSLENITIHQFRGLRELELKNLGQINLLVGINNSGKTSVLEALSIYCHPLDLKVWLNTARQREQEYRVSRTPYLDSLQWLFTHEAMIEQEQLNHGVISITGNGSFKVQKIEAIYEELEGIILTDSPEDKLNPNEIISEENEDLIDNNEELWETRKGINLSITVFLAEEQLSLINYPQNPLKENYQLWENSPLSRLSGKKEPSLLTSLVSPASHRSDIGQFRLLSEVRFANFKTDVIDLLRQMDSNISDLEILLPPHSLSSRFNIYIQHEKLGLVPVSTFGDGVRRLLHIALKLASVKGGILFIDELESAIHTEALQSSFNWLVKWCQKMNVQLFAT
ncbi:MAG: AAA family ATPase, partial [bacterium]